MTFAVPLFLIATLAGAIPVVLHMINRQKAKDLPFPTLRFLRISVEKTRRKRRIHDVLLMLLRIAVLVLIAMGLAKPAMTSLGSLLGGANSAVAIILDNSASMGLVDQERPRFETATAAAMQVLEEQAEGDQIVLMTTCGPAFPEQDRLVRTQDTIRQVLGQCRVTYQRADLAMKLQQARKLLAKSEAPNRQIYVISDMQELSWQGLKKEAGEKKDGGGKKEAKREEKKDDGKAAPPHPGPLPEGEGDDTEDASKIPIVFIDVNRTPKPDCAVVGVDVQAAVPIAGLPIKATVEVLNASAVAQQRHVELLIDGVKDQASPELNIPAEGRVKHEFLFTFKTSGLHRGEVHLVGDDGSKLDDRRFFAMEVDQGVPVAIVKPKRHEIPYLEDSFYLEQALSPGKSGSWAIRPSVITAADLLSEPLANYKVVYCVNLPAPDADVAERLRAYVAAGGNLVWIAGDNVLPEAYNQMNQQAKGQLLPAPLLAVRSPASGDNRDSWHISALDKKHPVLAHLTEPAALYQSVLVYKHVRMDTNAAADARVLARLDDGEALLAERNIERGKVLLLGTSTHTGWSNLPLRPIFLPLAVRLTYDLAAVEQARHSTLAGSPILVQLDDETRSVGVEVLPPSGETLRLKSQEESGRPGQIFRYAETRDIGIYLLRLLDAARPTQLAYAVNVDPDEADPKKVNREEMQKLLGRTPLVFADNPDDLSGTFALMREGRSLWEAFLAIVLFGLVFETFLSNRLTPKPPDESSAPQPPPGMRRLAKKAASGQS